MTNQATNLALPAGLTADSVLRLGHVTMTIKGFVKAGMVYSIGDRFYVQPRTSQPDTKPKPQPIDPFSPMALQIRGYSVIGGKTIKDPDLVMYAPGSYCTIPNAIRNGLLTETSLPFHLKDQAP